MKSDMILIIINLTLGILDVVIFTYAAFNFMTHVKRNLYRPKWMYCLGSIFVCCGCSYWDDYGERMAGHASVCRGNGRGRKMPVQQPADTDAEQFNICNLRTSSACHSGQPADFYY